MDRQMNGMNNDVGNNYGGARSTMDNQRNMSAMKAEDEPYNVSAVSLHQWISWMSLELRIWQEKLWQQRRDFKGEKVDPLLIQRSKVYNSLKDERDHWKKECGLLWWQLRWVQEEIKDWQREADFWKSDRVDRQKSFHLLLWDIEDTEKYLRSRGLSNKPKGEMQSNSILDSNTMQDESTQHMPLEKSQQLLNELRSKLHEGSLVYLEKNAALEENLQKKQQQ